METTATENLIETTIGQSTNGQAETPTNDSQKVTADKDDLMSQMESEMKKEEEKFAPERTKEVTDNSQSAVATTWKREDEMLNEETALVEQAPVQTIVTNDQEINAPVNNVMDNSQDEALQTINVSENPMHKVTGFILTEVLPQKASNVYKQDNTLVQMLYDDKKRPYIADITPDQMRGLLDRVVEFQKTTTSSVSYIIPPMNIIKDILSLGGYPESIRPISGISEVPIFRPDGTICNEPGYDRETHYFYAPDETTKSIHVPEAPTREDINRAAALFKDILVDFPFVDQSSFCNAIALMITPAIRPVINGRVPLGLIESTQKGTGKGLLTSIVSLITTGQMPETLTLPTAEGEVRRQITSTLRQGRPIIVYDNIENSISSPALASALTTEKWSDRILGQSTIKTFPNYATMIANGNNLRLGGDMSRRSYPIQFDPKSSRPWERSGFKYPHLTRHVKKIRAEILSAIFTICRAWFVAGEPASDVRPMGSFEEWARIVGGILSYAGFDGFIENLDVLYQDSDEEAVQFEVFFKAWMEHFQSRAVTAKEVSQSSLVELIPEAVLGGASRGNITQKLGKMFGKYAGTHFGDEGYHIIKCGYKSHTLTWQVKKEVTTS